MLALIKTPDPNDHPLRDTRPGAFKFLLLLSYSALLFNASAAMCHLIMLDRLGALPSRWALHGSSRAQVNSGGDQHDIRDLFRLELYGAGSMWTWARIHCEWSSDVGFHWYGFDGCCGHPGIFSIMAGSACLVFQTCFYIWLREALAVAITMSFVSAFAALPLFMFYVGD